MEKVIYSKWLAYELRKRGFPIVRTEINPNWPQYTCWVFAASEEFNKAFLELAAK